MSDFTEAEIAAEENKCRFHDHPPYEKEAKMSRYQFKDGSEYVVGKHGPAPYPSDSPAHPRFNGCRGRECLTDDVEVRVRVEADHSHTGEARDKTVAVDACIAPLVEKLYPLAASSCCGHGQTEGRILLYDGRVLRVYDDRAIEGAMPDGPWGYVAETEAGPEETE